MEHEVIISIFKQVKAKFTNFTDRITTLFCFFSQRVEAFGEVSEQNRDPCFIPFPWENKLTDLTTHEYITLQQQTIPLSLKAQGKELLNARSNQKLLKH